MTRILLILAALAAVAGCTTYKFWTESDSNEQEGTVKLSYEYRRYESPQVDERAGLDMARQRCADFGRKTAQRKGEERECVDGTPSDCSKWRVTREYRCLDKALK